MILQIFEGKLEGDWKLFTKAVERMAIENDLKYFLSKGSDIKLPEKAFADYANRADMERVLSAIENPDLIYLDADVEPYQLFKPLVQGKAYMAKQDQLGVFHMNGDKEMAGYLKEQLELWKTATEDGFPVCKRYHLAVWINMWLTKNKDKYLEIPEGYYNHRHLSSWGEAERKSILEKRKKEVKKIEYTKRDLPPDFLQFQKEVADGKTDLSAD